MGVDGGAEKTACPPELSPEVATVEAAVLRTRRQNHTSLSQFGQASIQSLSWPACQGSKRLHCGSAETIVSFVLTDVQLVTTCPLLVMLGATPFTRKRVRES